MSPVVASAQKQAELLKDQGNLYFKKERLGAAIEAYTEAITLCPVVPTYWTNRALCHRKRNEWERVEADCRKALELDKDSVKAHYMLGLALLESKQYGEAIKQLEKSLELGRGGKPGTYMVEEIWQELAKARYTEWHEAAVSREQQQKELKELCEQLLKEDYERRMALANENNTASKRQTPVEIDGVIHIDDDDDDDKFSQEQRSGDSPEEINKLHELRLSTLNEVFDKAGAPDRPGEVSVSGSYATTRLDYWKDVALTDIAGGNIYRMGYFDKELNEHVPDHLCCKITMDIFRDPVITPSGVTYERATLLEHMRKVGKFDPVTRMSLSPEQVVPNLAMKEAVQAYLHDHGWAYRT